ncbi:25445_t:CDS:2, partial [Dentiscutata erythropus]
PQNELTMLPDAPSRGINLFECLWDNVGCDNSAEKVESVETKTVNKVNTDRDEEGKTDMSESKVENLPKSPDEERIENDKVKAFKSC